MKQIIVVILASVYFSAVSAELLGEQLIRYCVQCTSGPLFFAIKSEGEVTCESYPPLKKVQYVHYILHPSDCELEFVHDYYTKDNLTHVQAGEIFLRQKQQGLLLDNTQLTSSTSTPSPPPQRRP